MAGGGGAELDELCLLVGGVGVSLDWERRVDDPRVGTAGGGPPLTGVVGVVF